MNRAADEGPIELALVGEMTDNEADLTQKMLEVPRGGACTIYFDSPGGSPYCALSLATLIKLRGIQATGIVTGECSSAALWPFAACRRRLLTPLSVLLFHPMKWQSEEHVGLAEAAEWSRHFAQLETDMDRLLAELLDVPFERIKQWITPGRYVSGPEFVEAGMGEMIPLDELDGATNGAPKKKRRKRTATTRRA